MRPSVSATLSRIKDTGLLHRVLYLRMFTPQLSLILMLFAPGDGQAELTWVID